MRVRAFGIAIVAVLSGCAEIQTVCPAGTEAKRRIYSGGAEAEWCRRPDGVHQGPEVRYYESGDRMIEGAFLDGVRQGEWHYYAADGSRVPWRRDRWEDGALVGKKVETPPRAANQPAIDPLAPTSSNIIKLASADPGLGRKARDDELPTFTSWYDDGKPRVEGHYDLDGLRTKTWRFWAPGGVVVRAVTYDAGVRHGSFREWHPNGRSKTEGEYEDGERAGRWRRWDENGGLLADQVYERGMLPP
jgi:antitoxin component YwqK of YwqJK toxin-antitoxin module